jgi:hypothetical protein
MSFLTLEGYKLLSTFRFQCDKCHQLGDAVESESEARAAGENHLHVCVPADPFMVAEDGTSVESDAIQKRRMPDIPGLGYLGWMYAGKCHVTFVNTKVNERFTYKIEVGRLRKEDPEEAQPPHFISVLVGHNNEDDYSYIGTVFHNTEGDKYVHNDRRSNLDREAPSVKAFQWILQVLNAGAPPEWLEIWHEGRCCVCGRLLTDPDSIVRGIGPVCLNGMLGR